ncbi:Ppx/GppA family phosphatase [Periweissella beninensis]|uniref:Ppx/GppA family phosphatase n=1 Tax=Periweissella beninensis TaxID=504936 RepID=UPI0021A64378|nr:Ppx/GppA family phosphatase [Periweissella beninensis]MCT4395464.1 Ppx/GppA family phosphatase [Periweissella beninensis]
MKIFAVIDLGSNSARMTVSEIMADGSYKVLERMQAMVRLSKDMGPDKILQTAEIDRTIKALKDFKNTLTRYTEVKICAVATAAVRQASNQAIFLKQVEKEVGIKLTVLSGEQEAHYDYIGVINTLKVKDALILDTGGASSELILVNNKKALHEVSVPIGAVNITETYLEKDKVTASSLFKAFTAIDMLFNNIDWLRSVQNLPIIALGGSNRTLGKISRRANKIQDTPLHGYRIEHNDAFDIYADILNKGLEQRKKVPGLAKERGDIIVGGMLPIISLLRYIDSSRIIFSQAGIREGILFEYIEEVTGKNVVEPEPATLTIDTEDLA